MKRYNFTLNEIYKLVSTISNDTTLGGEIRKLVSNKQIYNSNDPNQLKLNFGDLYDNIDDENIIDNDIDLSKCL